ncbi:MAG: PspC domain-containing protein [Actinomycetota bacterium]
MQTSAEPGLKPHARARGPFARSRNNRIIAGVAAGIAERLGVDPVVIRLSFVVLAAAGGVGVVGYLVAWLIAPERETPRDRTLTSPRQGLAIAMIVAGSLLLLRFVGLWFGDAIVWPIALGAFGSGILWMRSDESGRARWASLTSRIPGGPVDPFSGGLSPIRLAGGGLLIAAGMAGFLAANNALPAARTIGLATLVLGSGVALIFGPWIARLAREVSEERRERIRSEERAEVAAHLHDSVLQTLALIQRSTEPREMSTLARLQERELRAWLYGRGKPRAGESVRDEIERAAADVEGLHRIPIDVVVVGDAAVDDRLRAVVDACREAMVNGARHSGASSLSVYAEINDTSVACYVRDLGAGFDRTTVPHDRRGIEESIEGRMRRFGGDAEIVSSPGTGTEVRLTMPRTNNE